MLSFIYSNFSVEFTITFPHSMLWAGPHVYYWEIENYGRREILLVPPTDINSFDWKFRTFQQMFNLINSQHVPNKILLPKFKLLWA